MVEEYLDLMWRCRRHDHMMVLVEAHEIDGLKQWCKEHKLFYRYQFRADIDYYYEITERKSI